MRCSRGARGRQASCGSNAAKPGFSPGKLIYDHKKRSCGTGQTISIILKHEFRKKDQDGMGKVRGGGSAGHCLSWVWRNLSSLYSCSSRGPMDSAAQIARA